MPGNEIEDKIRILYELEKVSQPVDDSQSALIYDQWLEKQKQSFNLKNSAVQQFGKPKFYLWLYFISSNTELTA